ncbi:response regulator receiver modulated diguanylate cyclase [Halanaerobium saccharolyticum]|uniref:Stage 0 sporulation protein A homolog n=1 Tax=Halanaerobium saccharolyticum TaxID=43595 RepID=A0A4R7YUE0_9FIRM|nr:diguanylate cyclase [Halanaerobium saccharolyticum]RAK06364.1 response regulator receiver modulated diguanylate cyclase [Halanaerobium saccharolyticum]TDW00676.1 response regulator receiver modulated diguanylate cyclase [Halanaerobium saccharolyticum]TDX52289.1 response regulator receiver modulated diguanylate cyclase [Halanaerobium saccharolyticum]
MKINILVVDDDRDMRKLLENYLKRLEVEQIHFTDTAQKTYQLLNLNDLKTDPSVDLIILDIILGEENGIKICKKIKSNPAYQEVPIIMITAQKESGYLKDAFAAGAMDYLKKPIKKIEFMARINSAIILRKETKARIAREKELLKLSEELKKANQKLEKMALVDGLTGISNRRLFDKTIKKELKRARRKNNDLSLIMIDIDNFKEYNDTYGHQQGDQCLKEVASVLDKKTKRAADFAARYGGEEFAVILPDTAKDGALKIAEDIRKGIMDLKIEHKNSNTSEYVTVSLGVSSIKAEKEIDQHLIRSLIEQADQALYQAKENGKNQIVYKNFE